MKTKTLLWLAAGIGVAYYLYKNVTLTVSSDIPAISSVANLPKAFNVSDLLSKSTTNEPKIIRLKLSF